MSALPHCGFCLREIPPTELATEVQCGEWFQHLDFACENCLDKAAELKRAQIAAEMGAWQ